MPTFLPKDPLVQELKSLFAGARKRLYIVSPYLSLHTGTMNLDNYKPAREIRSAIKTLQSNKGLKLIVVIRMDPDGNFIKNSSCQDLQFFMRFADIEIRTIPSLHSKIYATERKILLSTMNLIGYSISISEEYGVVIPTSRSGKWSLKSASYKYLMEIIASSTLIYKSTPKFQRLKWYHLKKSFVSTNVSEDQITDLCNGFTQPGIAPTTIQLGYCILTGAQIPFNPKMPVDPTILDQLINNSWKNQEYRFCHYSGRRVTQDVTYRNPVLPEYLDRLGETIIDKVKPNEP